MINFECANCKTYSKSSEWTKFTSEKVEIKKDEGLPEIYFNNEEHLRVLFVCPLCDFIAGKEDLRLILDPRLMKVVKDNVLSCIDELGLDTFKKGYKRVNTIDKTGNEKIYFTPLRTLNTFINNEDFKKQLLRDGHAINEEFIEGLGDVLSLVDESKCERVYVEDYTSNKQVINTMNSYLQDYEFKIFKIDDTLMKYDEQLNEYYNLDQEKPLLHLIDDYISALEYSISSSGDEESPLILTLNQALQSKIVLLQQK